MKLGFALGERRGSRLWGREAAAEAETARLTPVWGGNK